MKAVLIAAASALVLAGCAGESGSSAAAPAEPSGKTCPVTPPNGRIPAESNDWAGNDPASSHGNGELWTLFWPGNVVLAGPEFVQEDGSIRMKWPWFRGVSGELRVTGRRLDGDAAPLRAEVPPYYGPSGFQPTAIFFPEPGCWQVTGRAGSASLTFVTLVREAGREAP